MSCHLPENFNFYAEGFSLKNGALSVELKSNCNCLSRYIFFIIWYYVSSNSYWDVEGTTEATFWL